MPFLVLSTFKAVQTLCIITNRTLLELVATHATTGFSTFNPILDGVLNVKIRSKLKV